MLNCAMVSFPLVIQRPKAILLVHSLTITSTLKVRLHSATYAMFAIWTEKYLPLLPMRLATQTSVRYVRYVPYVSCVAECLILGYIFKTSRWTGMRTGLASRCQLRASVISHSDYNTCYVYTREVTAKAHRRNHRWPPTAHYRPTSHSRP
jgi:hypothetical protein